MSETEIKGVVVGYFFRKKDKLLEELKHLQDNLEVLQGAIECLHEPNSDDFPMDANKNKQGALASMYMDKERLQIKIEEKKNEIRYINDIIAGVAKGG